MKRISKQSLPLELDFDFEDEEGPSSPKKTKYDDVICFSPVLENGGSVYDGVSLGLDVDSWHNGFFRDNFEIGGGVSDLPLAISNGLQAQDRKGLGKPTGTWQQAQALVGKPIGDSGKIHTRTSACAHYNLPHHAISNGLKVEKRKGLGKPTGTWEDALALVDKPIGDGSGKKHTKTSACAHYNLPHNAIYNGLQAQNKKSVARER